MYVLVSTQTTEISPAKAQEYLSHTNTFGGQRTLDMRWATHLAKEMAEGRAVKGSIAFAENGDGVRVLMNGQHQLQAAVISNKTFKATIDYYKVDNDDDLWHLFGKFDTHKMRSETNVMKAARGLFTSEALRMVDTRTLGVCGTALVFLGGGHKPDFRATVLSKTEKADLVQKYEEDVLFIKSIIDESQCKRITSGVATVAIASNRVSTEAWGFWVRVLGGHDLAKNSPEWRLHKEIHDGMTAKVGMISGNRYLRQWNLAVSWWNAFITNTPRSAVKLEAIKGAVEIIGDNKAKKSALP